MNQPPALPFSLLLVLCLAWMPGGQAADAVQKVVYHINDDSAQHQMFALRTIANLLNITSDTTPMDVRVVLHGKGVSMLVLPEAMPHLKALRHANASNEMAAMVDTLRDRGVRFELCANSLKRHDIDREYDLYNVEIDDIVPSGVAELARLQQLGYVYIKP